jgi:hypothetical protein
MKHRTILKNAMLSVLGFICIAAYDDELAFATYTVTEKSNNL